MSLPCIQIYCSAVLKFSVEKSNPPHLSESQLFHSHYDHFQENKLASYKGTKNVHLKETYLLFLRKQFIIYLLILFKKQLNIK